MVYIIYKLTRKFNPEHQFLFGGRWQFVFSAPVNREFSLFREAGSSKRLVITELTESPGG